MTQGEHYGDFVIESVEKTVVEVMSEHVKEQI